jgi:hypothetical protein
MHACCKKTRQEGGFSNAGEKIAKKEGLSAPAVTLAARLDIDLSLADALSNEDQK